MTSLVGSTVLVTGANGGLGSQFVRQALERGAARVYATARRPLAWDDDRVVALPLDVTDDRSVLEVAAQAPDVDVVVNNAGIIRPGSLLEGPLVDLEATLDTNLLGPLRVARAFAPVLRRRGGALVNVASVLSWLATAGSYSVSKAALWSATDALRLELAPDVQVLGVYLAYTDTPMIAALDVPKNDPGDVVRAVWDALERGDAEVLADQLTRQVRAALSGPVGELYARAG